jgi:hypothetical protein
LSGRAVRGGADKLRELGLDTVRLAVVGGNARAICTRSGVCEEELTLVVSLDELAQTLAADGEL